MPVRFIAEIGQNHNGSFETAKKMVDELRGSGAWAIKTAKRNVDLHKDEWSKITNYRGDMNYYEHRKDLELTKGEFIELKEYVENAGFIFMSSFTDRDSLEFLYDIGVQYYKVASSRNIDHKLIEALKDNTINQSNVFISDGMTPDFRVLNMARDNGWKCLSCTSAYPTDHLSVPGRGIEQYDGFSAHWDYHNPLNAVMFAEIDVMLFGAIRSAHEDVYIERHVTLDINQPGIDHRISIECNNVERYIESLKVLDQIMQTPKQIFPDELPAIKKLRHDILH